VGVCVSLVLFVVKVFARGIPREGRWNHGDSRYLFVNRPIGEIGEPAALAGNAGVPFLLGCRGGSLKRIEWKSESARMPRGKMKVGLRGSGEREGSGRELGKGGFIKRSHV
jgi:hypothetical protein